MSRSTQVPITPSVLQWAINDSGFSYEEIADAIGVTVGELRSWETSGEKPTLTQAKKLASKLHRPFAALLLPSPPKHQPVAVQFRHPADRNRSLNPAERRHLRRAARLQETLSWIARELNANRVSLPSATISDSPARAANKTRDSMNVPTSEQLKWPTAAVAFDNWREALERIGVAIFLFSMGSASCQGFSIWDDAVPVISVNTAWNEEARIFTLFHELGHLVTRTSSACLTASRHATRTDPVERWCERFAAEALLPAGDVRRLMATHGWREGKKISDLSLPKRVATRFKVSLRAAVIRIIELKTADWDLYDQIPPLADDKKGGGGGSGRTRTVIREDQLGDRTTGLLARAVREDLIDRWRAVELLDVPDVAFDLMSTDRSK